MSKRFTFRLESLRRLRQHKTNEAKISLGEVSQMCVAKVQEIQALQRYHDEIKGNTGLMKVMNHQMRSEHALAVKEDLKRLAAELVNLREIEALRRMKLTEAMKEEKILDSLRDKKEIQHKHDLLVEEQGMMDEIASRREHTRER